MYVVTDIKTQMDNHVQITIQNERPNFIVSEKDTKRKQGLSEPHTTVISWGRRIKIFVFKLSSLPTTFLLPESSYRMYLTFHYGNVDNCPVIPFREIWGAKCPVTVGCADPRKKVSNNRGRKRDN